MTLTLRQLCCAALALVLVACGGKPQEETTTPAEKQPAGAADAQDQEKAEQRAKQEIEDWLGEALARKVKILGAEVGTKLGNKLGQDGEVKSAAAELFKNVMTEPAIKPRVDKIADDATGGVMNKVQLGLKALRSGGVDQYKKEVREEAQAAAVPVLTEHIKSNLFKDPRAAAAFKGFGDALRLPVAISATAVQDNLSPEASKKLRNIALKIATSTDKAKVAAKVSTWADNCEGDAEKEVERFFKGLAKLSSFEAAIKGLAVEVLKHPRTKQEIATAAGHLLSNSEVSRTMTQLYEDAAFKKGQTQIQQDVKSLVKIPVFNEELFGVMERLVSAEGAGPILAKHAAVISEDPKLADLIDEFVLNTLEACGEPL